jgi:hypothetical protein
MKDGVAGGHPLVATVPKRKHADGRAASATEMCCGVVGLVTDSSAALPHPGLSGLCAMRTYN